MSGQIDQKSGTVHDGDRSCGAGGEGVCVQGLQGPITGGASGFPGVGIHAQMLQGWVHSG